MTQCWCECLQGWLNTRGPTEGTIIMSLFESAFSALLTYATQNLIFKMDVLEAFVIRQVHACWSLSCPQAVFDRCRFNLIAVIPTLSDFDLLLWSNKKSVKFYKIFYQDYLTTFCKITIQDKKSVMQGYYWVIQNKNCLCLGWYHLMIYLNACCTFSNKFCSYHHAMR